MMRGGGERFSAHVLPRRFASFSLSSEKPMSSKIIPLSLEEKTILARVARGLRWSALLARGARGLRARPLPVSQRSASPTRLPRSSLLSLSSRSPPSLFGNEEFRVYAPRCALCPFLLVHCVRNGHVLPRSLQTPICLVLVVVDDASPHPTRSACTRSLPRLPPSSSQSQLEEDVPDVCEQQGSAAAAWRRGERRAEEEEEGDGL